MTILKKNTLKILPKLTVFLLYNSYVFKYVEIRLFDGNPGQG